ncbi:MAG: LPS assembly lipoprotein LptE, partial [Limisphaerales bacterium]
LQQDGTFRLETQGSGDLVLSGKITKFDRSELAFQPTDTLTPQDYTLTMSAEITAVARTTGKTNLNRTVIGRTTIRVGADLASAERQAVPLLAEDLARNAVSSLADGSW